LRSKVLRKHLTLSLEPMPRGSTPTTSNRSSTGSDHKSGAASANAVAEPPGPPSLTNKDPILRFWSRALTRNTASWVVAPLGWS
jgi:hypothetical protein